MPAEPAAPSPSAPAPAIRGEAAGEGPPIVLCHGITATRRYVIHGSRALERAGHRGRLLRRPRPRRVRPGPGGRGLWIPGAGRRPGAGGREPRWGRAASLLGGPLDGRPHGGRLRAGAIPSALRGAGRDRAGLRRRDRGELARATGTGSPPRSRRGASTASSPTSTATRGSTRPGATRCCASPASGCCAIAISTRVVDAAARGPALAARSGRWRSWRRCACRPWSSPATTPPTPAIPARSPRPTPSALPRARLVTEAEGQSPLAWQGGRLSREIAAFCAADPAETARMSL